MLWTSLRNTDTSLPRISTVELNPGIMYRIVANREAVHSRPKSPTGPFPNMGLDLVSHYESNKVEDLSRDHRAASEIESVGHVGEIKHDSK